MSINRNELNANFLKSEIQELLELSKFTIPSNEELCERARTKLQRVKEYVRSRQSKAIESSIALDFNYSERCTVLDLRSRMMRRWIGSFNNKLKKESQKVRKDIVGVRKSVKIVDQRKSLL
jgi:hypothetical protein